MGEKSSMRVVTEISVVSIIFNILLSGFKLIAGVVAHSGAMISDAVHSLSDVLTSGMVIVGYGVSRKERDDNHPYGHERLESIAATILATILALVGLGIGYAGVQKIMLGIDGELAMPGALALWAAAISIVVKEAMYWYTRHGAKKVNSSALMAEAWHHRSDAFSSIGAFVGILGARLGFPILDPIASLIICIFILKAAYDIYREAVDKLIDRTCDKETEAQMREVVLAQEGVLALDLLYSRLFGDRVYVDVEISCDGELNLYEAHEIAENVHFALENAFADIKHCMVHVNPYGIGAAP